MFVCIFLDLVNMTNRATEKGVVLNPTIVYKQTEHKENQVVRFRNFVENKYKIKLSKWCFKIIYYYACFILVSL